MRMKRAPSILCAIGLFVSTLKGFTSTPFFLPRSQGQDSARWIAGWVHEGNRLETVACTYGTFAITPEYTQTIQANDIERYLFGEDLFDDCCDPYLKISGSRIITRNNEKEWLADYFGLPTDFESIVRFNPMVKNFILEANGYIGLNQLAQGVYLNISLPFVFTQWFLDMHETVLNHGSQGYVAGYFSPDPVPRTALLNRFTDFISDGKAPNLPNDITFCPLDRSVIAAKKQNKFGVADIHLGLGYNFILAEDYHIGLSARAVLPTGTRPKGLYLFEPIIGNGHFFEFGAGISTHAVLWRSELGRHEWSFALEAWVTHMFKSRQTRSFDLKGADNSRYMLGELMVENSQGLQGLAPGATFVAADFQFNRVLTPLANITTVPVDVSVLWNADVTILFNYKGCNWEFDFGYNVWTRRPEDVSIVDSSSCNLIDVYDWGVKGDAQIYGYNIDTLAPVALSATQLNATVTGGFNFPETSIGEGVENRRIDNPLEAYQDGIALTTTPGGTTPINTSIQPRILTDADLAPCRTTTHGISNGIFGHLNYTWWEDDCWYIPYIGFGAKVELAPEKPDQSCPTLCTHNPVIGASPCGTCDLETLLQTGLAQWCVWLKGGLRFN